MVSRIMASEVQRPGSLGRNFGKVPIFTAQSMRKCLFYWLLNRSDQRIINPWSRHQVRKLSSFNRLMIFELRDRMIYPVSFLSFDLWLITSK